MQERSNLIAFLLIGLVIGGLSGYMTRPESTEFKLGPLSFEVRSDEVARGGGPLTRSQVQHIAILTALGGVIGLAGGVAGGEGGGCGKKGENFFLKWFSRETSFFPGVGG